jgi:ribosomal protein L11 methylase PrmA
LKEQKIKSHFDILLANLTARDIQENWKALTALSRPETYLILAGVEKSQQSWFEPWLKKEKKWTLIDQKKESDWIGYMLGKGFK